MMIMKNPLEGFIRHNVLLDDKLYQEKKGIPLEIFIHKNLLDTYNGLYKWFIKHQEIFVKLTNILYTKGILWPQQMQTFGKKEAINYIEEIDAPILPYDKYLDNQSLTGKVWYVQSIRSLLNMDSLFL